MNGVTTTTTETMVMSTALADGRQGAETILRLGNDPSHAQNERPATPHSGGGVQTTSGRHKLEEPAQTYVDVNAEARAAADSGSKMRPRHMTIELPNDHIEVLYDRKLSLEDPSPKPCIAPGNALHLIDDDPSPRSQTPSSVIIVSGELDGNPARDIASTDAERSSSEPPPPGRPAPRVRFRSRVRITSGVHRHRHGKTDSGTPTGRVQAPSATPSSVSSSPSSSISAPLRYHADEHAAWGPLGRRLNAYANAAGRPKRALSSPGLGAGARQNGPGQPPDERTPLVRSARRPGHLAGSYDRSHLNEREEEDFEEALRAAALRREEEAMFGPWPQRLFNRHWWWWHMEPVLCCTYCSEDSDYDE